MKAVILAGGRGERLMPITNEIPKPLIRIGGKNVIEWQIKALKKSNISEIIVCGHYKFEKIKDFFGEMWDGMKITYVDERIPMGTGGAIKNAESALEGEGDFIVFNGDVVTDIDMTEAIEFHKKTKSICTLILRNTDHPATSNVVEIDAEGRIVNFIGRGQEIIKTGHTGLSVFNRAIFQLIPCGKSDIEKDVIFDAYRSHNTRGFMTNSYVSDMGTFERIAKIEQDMINGVMK